MTPGQLPEPIVHNILQTDLNDIASALGIASTSIKASSTINVGAVWMTLQLSNSDEVRGLRPDMEKLADLTPRGVVGVTVFGRTAANIDSHIEVRSFAPREGIAEDPVCGSGNGCVAVLVRQHKLQELSLIHISEPTRPY